MKLYLFYVLSITILFLSTYNANHLKTKDKQRYYVPSILFPDIIPFVSPHYLRRYQYNETKNNAIIEKNNSYHNISNPINDTNNFLDNNINSTEKKTTQNESTINFLGIKKDNNSKNRPFHILECLTYLKKETLTPQLLVCLGMFFFVLFVMICVQLGFAAKEKREKEFQRVFKMAINENC